jgi:hypothetical protein
MKGESLYNENQYQPDTIRWFYAYDEEGPYFGGHETREAAIAEAKSESAAHYDATSAIIARGARPRARVFATHDFDWMVDCVNDRVPDHACEFITEDWEGIEFKDKRAAEKEFDELLEKFMEKHLKVDWSMMIEYGEKVEWGTNEACNNQKA